MSLEAKKNRERVRVRVAVTHTSATALQNSRKGKLESGVSSHRRAVLMLCLLPARWGSDVRNGCDPVKGGGKVTSCCSEMDHCGPTAALL